MGRLNMKSYQLYKIEKLKPGDHLCCIYETDKEHKSIITPYIRFGLENNEKVFYIVDSRTSETVLDYLRDDGIDVNPYLESGQLAILTINESYMKEGIFDPDGMIDMLSQETEKALKEDFDALRVTGEMSWALRGLPGSERLIEYEAKLNQFFQDNKCLAICQYDTRVFDPEILIDILETHPIAVIGTEIYDNFYYVPAEEFLAGKLPEVTLKHWKKNLKQRKLLEMALKESIDTLELKVKERTEDLRRSDNYNRSLIEVSIDPLVTIGADGKITDLNKAVEIVTGYKREEIIGTDFSSYFTAQDKAEEGYKRVFHKGWVKNYPLEIQHKDGHITPVMYNASVFHDEKGNIMGVFAAARDITELKKIEDTLKESEQKYRTIIETAQEGIWIIDENANTRYVNLSMAEMLGYIVEEMLGKSLFDFMDDTAKIDAQAKMERRRKGLKEIHDFRFRNKNGFDVWIMVSTNPLFDKEGVFKGALGMMSDITTRKMAEEEIKSQIKLTNSINEVLQDSIKAENDKEVAIIFLSVAEKLTNSKFGFIKEINEKGTTDTLAISDPGWDKCNIPQSEAINLLSNVEIISYWGRVLKQGKPIIVNNPEYGPDSMGVPEGNPPINSFLGIPLKRGDKTIGIIALANKEEGYGNVDQKKIETLAVAFIEALYGKRAEDHLKSSLKEKEMLLKEIHHRVKNNLAVISSLLNLQSEYIKNKDDLELFRESQTRAKSMALIHERLYNSADLKSIDFGEYINKLVNDLFQTYNLDSSLIKLNMDIESILLDINISIPLGLIVNELVSNCMKYAFPDGREGTINIKLKSNNGKNILIVSDNGIGLSSDIDFKDTDSLGLQLINSLTYQIDAEIELDISHGTEFKIIFNELEYK